MPNFETPLAAAHRRWISAGPFLDLVLLHKSVGIADILLAAPINHEMFITKYLEIWRTLT